MPCLNWRENVSIDTLTPQLTRRALTSLRARRLIASFPPSGRRSPSNCCAKIFVPQSTCRGENYLINRLMASDTREVRHVAWYQKCVYTEKFMDGTCHAYAGTYIGNYSVTFNCTARTTVSRDVQTRFSVQLAFAKFLSKIKRNF